MPVFLHTAPQLKREKVIAEEIEETVPWEWNGVQQSVVSCFPNEELKRLKASAHNGVSFTGPESPEERACSHSVEVKSIKTCCCVQRNNNIPLCFHSCIRSLHLLKVCKHSPAVLFFFCSNGASVSNTWPGLYFPIIRPSDWW